MFSPLILGPIETALARSNIREEKIFTDFTVISEEGKKFPCHKLILGTQSPVLMAMMTSDMKEKKDSEVKLEYSEEVVKMFVDFFYIGDIPQEILQQNLNSFLELADFYHLGSLKLKTEAAAVKKMNPDNMVDMYVLAGLYRAEELEKAAEMFMRKNKESLKKRDLSDLSASVCADIVRLLC